MRYRLLPTLPIASILGLLITAAAVQAAPAEPTPTSAPAPLEAPAATPDEVFRAALSGGVERASANVRGIRYAIGPDTVRYRVCKDLSVCYLDFAAPVIGIASPVLPPGVAPVSLVPIEVLAFSPRVTVATPWMLIGFPVLAYAFIDRGQSQIPGGQGGGGGGAPPPGNIEPPTTQNPPGTDPPGTNPPPLTNVAPEPVSMILLATGLAGLALLRRRRRASLDG